MEERNQIDGRNRAYMQIMHTWKSRDAFLICSSRQWSVDRSLAFEEKQIKNKIYGKNKKV